VHVDDFIDAIEEYIPFEEDVNAVAEYEKQIRCYDELRRANGGFLLFRQDVERMKIVSAEKARRKRNSTKRS
jgi:hypothetical protein